MDSLPPEPIRRAALRSWFVILFTAPVVLGAGFWAYQWQTGKQEMSQLANDFIQRQNRVLAHDALRVSGEVSSLLLQAARDLRAMAALPAQPKVYESFLQALKPLPSLKREPEGQGAFPVYNRALVASQNGKLLLIRDGRIDPSVTRLSECLAKDLCDVASVSSALKLETGKVYIGKGLRWYTPQGAADSDGTGTLSVALKGERGVFVLGIDFHSFDLLTRLPAFPYQKRGEALEDYEAGNYIYILDRDTDLLAHPKPWHVMGIDRQTGQALPPMRNDADAGKRPLNFTLYQEGVLRPYFDRLLERSFKASEVDVFQAANLSGTIRVISIAPIIPDSEVFGLKGPFGYAGVGCALEYFEEPEPRLIPYY